MKKLLYISVLFVVSIPLNAQELQTYLEEAERNNPKIQRFELQYQIASEKVNQASSLPNTDFGVGVPVSSPETRTGPQRFKVSAKQRIPWFGVITARKNYASSVADAQYEDIAITRRKLVADVSQSYYKLYALKAQQVVFDEQIALLKTYETLALNSVETGKASAVDVLKLQIRQNELTASKSVLEQQFLAEQTHFNKLLNREKSIAVAVVDGLELLLEGENDNLDNLKLHPELVKYDKLFAAVEQSELVNQKESSPSLGFGLDYIAVAEGPITNFNDNGKDILIPSVSFSIPILNKKYKSQSKQNKLRQEQLLAEKQERENVLESLLDAALKNKTAARIQHDTQIKNLEQSKNAEQILLKNYETGTIDFNDVLDIQELGLKFEMNRIRAIQQYYIQHTIINYLTYQ
ncbi:TolC family protein [Spongiivirga sp. MCCC 1A20706]|uniref:TolC family protein n=1 Tax=Spongiivirga sp. MCCC 1A20706 TaxID=3160963 RepID=UPI0039777D3B